MVGYIFDCLIGVVIEFIMVGGYYIYVVFQIYF